MQKKKWERPELIVLVRGRPEEAVLQMCKGDLLGVLALTDLASCVFFACAGACMLKQVS